MISGDDALIYSRKKCNSSASTGKKGLVTNSDRKGCHWFDNYKSEREEVTGNILLSGLQQAKPNWLSSTDAKEVNCYADTGAACQ